MGAPRRQRPPRGTARARRPGPAPAAYLALRPAAKRQPESAGARRGPNRGPGAAAALPPAGPARSALAAAHGARRGGRGPAAEAGSPSCPPAPLSPAARVGGSTVGQSQRGWSHTATPLSHPEGFRETAGAGQPVPIRAAGRHSLRGTSRKLRASPCFSARLPGSRDGPVPCRPGPPPRPLRGGSYSRHCLPSYLSSGQISPALTPH